MNLNTVIAGHIEKLSVRKIGPQKWGTEECSPITPPVWSYFIGCPEEQQPPVKQSGKSLLANETENGNTCNCLRRGKTQTIQLRSVLVQHFIGWQGGASFPDNLRVRLCKTNAIWDYFGRSVTNFLDAFPWFKLCSHSAFVTKPCSTFPKPLFQNEGKSWKLFQPQRCQFFFTRKEKCLVVLCSLPP